jgi:hypothetical protein
MLAQRGEQGALDLADGFCRIARRRIRHLFAELFGPTDTRMYRLAQQVLRGEHTWLEAGIVGIEGLAPDEPVEESRPAAEHVVVGDFGSGIGAGSR